LTVSGQVKKFVTLSQNSVFLRGTGETVLKKTVTITPQQKYPFKIVAVETKKSGNIATRLEAINSTISNTYKLTVTNLKQNKGRYVESVTLKTDSPVRSEIKIRVYGHILEKPKG